MPGVRRLRNTWRRAGSERSRIARAAVAPLLLTVLLLVSRSAVAGGVGESPAGPMRAAEPDPDPGVEAWIEGTLAQLDLRERVGQLILAWVPGGEIAEGSARFDRIRRWIEEDRVGGLIVSSGPADEFAPTLNRFQSYASVPLLVVSDLETGPGMRLRGGTRMPPAMGFGAARSEGMARAAGEITAAEAHAAGIHATLGPVLDVNSNPNNPIINVRSFGEDPDRVARMGVAWMEGARAGSLLTVVKHFPGHGATEVDSHIGLPTIQGAMEALEATELRPFQAAIEAGADGVLVGHIAVPAVDGALAPPASLSHGVITGLLRERFGFDGLIMTDALNMGAIVNNYTVPEAAILALEAGADLLLQPPDHEEVIDRVVEAVEIGRIPPERIDASVRRVLRAKARAGLHAGPSVRASGAAAPGSHARQAEEIAAAAVTLVKDEARMVPLPAAAREVMHVAYASGGRTFGGSVLTGALRATGRSVDAARVDDRTRAREYDALRRRARAADVVILSANLVPREYQGPLAVTPGFAGFVEGMAEDGVTVVAISFGSPYLLDAIPDVPTYLIGWAADAESQSAMARALLGAAPIGGRLPVSLPPNHLIDAGVERPGPGAANPGDR